MTQQEIINLIREEITNNIRIDVQDTHEGDYHIKVYYGEVVISDTYINKCECSCGGY